MTVLLAALDGSVHSVRQSMSCLCQACTYQGTTASAFASQLQDASSSCAEMNRLK